MTEPQDTAQVREQLEELYRRHAGSTVEGVVSFYPPEAEARRGTFGLSGVHVGGARVGIGDCAERFPLHSISKVSTYALALEDNRRAATLARVGVEPSGDPYNSVSFDEIHHHRTTRWSTPEPSSPRASSTARTASRRSIGSANGSVPSPATPGWTSTRTSRRAAPVQ